jgi:hypothetical protein
MQLDRSSHELRISPDERVQEHSTSLVLDDGKLGLSSGARSINQTERMQAEASAFAARFDSNERIY